MCLYNYGFILRLNGLVSPVEQYQRVGRYYASATRALFIVPCHARALSVHEKER